jgi:AraC-like DNA-binding protein
MSPVRLAVREPTVPTPVAAALQAAPAQEAGTLLPVVFSTSGVDLRHRFDFWCSKYGSFNSLKLLSPEVEGFDACNEIWSFGQLALVRNSAPAMAYQRTMRQIRGDCVDHWVIRVAHSGQARLRIGDAAFRKGPMRPVLFTLGLPHEGDRSQADWISLYIPRDSFPDLTAGLDRLGSRVLDSPGAGLLVDYMTMLERRMPRVTLAELPALAEATRAMVAACLLNGVSGNAISRRDAEVTRLERLRQVIRLNIASPTLTPEKLCRLAGVSRSQLYRLFEPNGGVARYIQAQRLRLAHAMLADPDCRLTVAAIAERVGHFDASAFSRAFRQEFGYTPSEARAAFGGGPPEAPMRSCTPYTADFGGILRRLGSATATTRLPP